MEMRDIRFIWGNLWVYILIIGIYWPIWRNNLISPYIFCYIRSIYKYRGSVYF